MLGDTVGLTIIGHVTRTGGSRICEKLPEKVAQRGGGGGDSDFFFFCVRHLHYGVGVPSAYQTDLRGEKQKKKKKKNRPKKGGGAAADSAPWIRH